ncbi:MAG: hypothetical protein GWP08_09465, partial [Nitrospiraceae bacterium]|nr:hypothetical protein [Nitrospiraceae bacterium]
MATEKGRGPSVAPGNGDSGMDWSAKWIWKQRDDYTLYNDTIIARKAFDLPFLRRAKMAITADTRYRLFINGEWVNDGPSRSWPTHYQYDEIDVTPYLHEGQNTIRVIAKFFGAGTFHQVPQQAGLLVQIDVQPLEGAPFSIGTDNTWEVAEARGWLSNTPKACVQMGPFEIYDARLESTSAFGQAQVLYGAHEGPWQGLNPRDCPLLTREPFALRRFVGSSVVERAWMSFGFPTAQLLYPGVVKANHHVSMASAVATVIECPKPITIRIAAPGSTVLMNGNPGKDGTFELAKGDNFLFSAVTDYFSHWRQDNEIRFVDTEGFVLRNPLNNDTENPWCFVPFEEAKYVSSDIAYGLLSRQEKDKVQKKISETIERYLKSVTDVSSFKHAFDGRVQPLSTRGDLADGVHWQFKEREVLGDAAKLIENPAGLLNDNAASTVVHPSAEGEIELLYDLGEQNCGYYKFDLVAEEGLIVDLFG